MPTERKRPSGLTPALLEIANDLRDGEFLDEAAYQKITKRHLGDPGTPMGAPIEPLTGDDIRVLRERARMSQAVFAQHLNVTAGYVSQLERGAKCPTGPALVLLDVIRRKGIQAIL